MTTRIDQLNMDNSNNEVGDMKSDDNSQIVKEILQEMSNENMNENITQDVVEDPNTFLDRQIDPNVNMSSRDNLNPEVVPVNDTNIDININEELSLKDKLIKHLKSPLIVAVLSAVIFSPILQKLLEKYVPKLYGFNASTTFTWLGLLVKSSILAILYFCLTQLI